jgi:hypothetical protein
MILAILLLLSGLTISAVAIYYSVMGLMAIFSAAAIPIMIMGISLEIGKLVTASWVKAHWPRLPWLMRSYAVTAVAILMFITSLGIFGFLSKAHSDQTLVSGDVQSRIAIYDEKIKTAKENIEADRRQIKQMDEAVDQIMGRSTDEKGADKANAVRKSQQKDRAALARDIEANQKTISQLNDEAAPIRAENRKVEAEVGPIKYIAAFVYGDNPDSSILERAVTWVIILIVIVFDPLAVVMLLASQMTFAWIRAEREPQPTIAELDTFVGEKPTPEELESVEEEEHTPVKVNKHTQSEVSNDSNGEPPSKPEPIMCYKCGTELLNAPGIGLFCPNKECTVADAVNGETVELPEPTLYEQHPYLNRPWGDGFNNEKPRVYTPETLEPVTDNNPHTPGWMFDTFKESVIPEHTELTAEEQSAVDDTMSMEIADMERPGDYVTPPVVETATIPEAAPGKNRGVLNSHLVASADNSTVDLGTPSNTGFGNEFPAMPNKGDVYLRTDYLPNRLFKYNGTNWMQVDKDQTYAYEDEYIKYLVDQIDAGKYDPDLLTDLEREQIQLYLIKNAQ